MGMSVDTEIDAAIFFPPFTHVPLIGFVKPLRANNIRLPA
jgi:hypothetical protein